MQRYTAIALDSLGNPKANTTIKICATGSTVAAGISLAGTPIANPLTTDSNGRFTFDIVSGIYDFLDSSNVPMLVKVQIVDFFSPGEWLSASGIPVGALSAPYGNVGAALDALISGSHGSTNAGSPGAGITLTPAISLIYSKRYTIPYTALLGLSGLSDGVSLGTLPPKTLILAPLISIVSIAFAGTALLSARLSIGVTQGAGASSIASQQDLFGAPATRLHTTTQPAYFAAGTAFFANFVLTGIANFAALSAGSVDVVIPFIVVP